METKVFYNKSCSICSFEINHYKKTKNNIEWIDINNVNESKIETNKNAKELLRRLHTKKNNKVFSGVDAFIEMWLEIPKYRFLAKIIRKPIDDILIEPEEIQQNIQKKYFGKLLNLQKIIL